MEILIFGNKALQGHKSHTISKQPPQVMNNDIYLYQNAESRALIQYKDHILPV